MYPPHRQNPRRSPAASRSQIAVWWVGVLAGCLSILAAAEPAMAFDRTQTCDSYGTSKCAPNQTPKPIEWPAGCVRYHIHEAGSNDFPPRGEGTIGPTLRELVRQAFETWNAPSCTDFTLVEGGLTSESARYDSDAGLEGNTNVIQWHDETWPYESMPTAFALTSVSYKDNGWIENADIEFNSATYDFSDLSESKTDEMTTEVDLRNTLTHEIGHFIGLAHSEESEATMHGTAPLGEIEKRTLHHDDIDGLCTIYPDASHDDACDDPEDFKRPLTPDEEAATEPTCSTTGHPPTPGFLAVAAGCLIVAAGRIRRRT